ncbi:hypothetical protein CEXT_598451 [Caerostris extrusa]|uniref:Uncharacterized protein n=1 Tax=Caerostris extrusa TaxID=172846 RepID=A0AAV4R823_CAEEX|nr:hypothetical protein CEXT_598451 [Caerostris extrusa]
MQNEKSNWKHSLEIRKLSIVCVTVTVAAKKKNIIISVSPSRITNGSCSYFRADPCDNVVEDVSVTWSFPPPG